MTTVLIVEDNAEIRAGLKRSLAERGYDVKTSATGLGGLSIIVDDHPDVVLLDLGLPDIDGVDLLRM
ncbi:MAG TPA: response regulator, partial [Acidimicrobiales bacterium]|nr:response regulator [Acidimicrobiales bacterium]